MSWDKEQGEAANTLRTEGARGRKCCYSESCNYRRRTPHHKLWLLIKDCSHAKKHIQVECGVGNQYSTQLLSQPILWSHASDSCWLNLTLAPATDPGHAVPRAFTGTKQRGKKVNDYGNKNIITSTTVNRDL